MWDLKHIAMWSGPRNISTALMRSWESRSDTMVVDEPLYAFYLKATGRTDHPGHQATLAHHSTDWQTAVTGLFQPAPEGISLCYQKQMAHHLLPQVKLSWTNDLVSCFLIRDPVEMITSLREFLPSPTAADTGLPQQVRLFESIRQHAGNVPPVIDARDLLNDPEGMLRLLCGRLRVPFDDAMLSWKPGPRDSDGAWAPYWYDKVYQTTSFGPYRPKGMEVPPQMHVLRDECLDLYQQLAEYRITTTTADAPKEK